MAKIATKAKAEPEDKADAVTLKVTGCQTSSPTAIAVNGAKFSFPLNEPVTVPAFVEDTLANVSGVTFEKMETK